MNTYPKPRGVSRVVAVVAIIIIIVVVAAALMAAMRPSTQAAPGPTTPQATTPQTTAAPQQQQTTKAPTVVKLGCLFDLTGATSDVGTIWAEGVRAAIKAVNDGKLTRLRELGIQLQCIERDYGYKVPEAQSAYQYFRQQGVVAIVGWGTGDTLALAPSVNKDHIPYMSGSHTVTLTRNKYNFFPAISYQDAAIAAVRFAKSYFDRQGKPAKLALTYPNVPYGVEPLPSIRAEAKRLGVEICREEVVELTASSAREQLTRIRDTCGPDVAIWIGGTAASAAVIIRDSYAVGLDRAIIISNVWGVNELTPKLVGPDVLKAVGGRVYVVYSNLAWSGVVDLANRGDQQAKLLVDYVKGGFAEPVVRGWLAVYLYAKAIEKLATEGKPITGEAIADALETMGPLATSYAAPLQYSQGDHRPTMEAWIHVLNANGTLSLVQKVTLERPPFDYYGLTITPAPTS